MVRTFLFHGKNMGSIPIEDIRKIMQLIKLKPINNSNRSYNKFPKHLLAKDTKFLRCLYVQKKSSFGRNAFGRITSWHRQRGAKKLYRRYPSITKESANLALFLVHDPSRTSFSTVYFDLYTKQFKNFSSINGVYPGSVSLLDKQVETYRLGYRTQLKYLPTGAIISSIGNSSGNRISFAKAAGSFAQIIQTGNKFTKIKLPSNVVITLPSSRYATLGITDNLQNHLLKIGKAGRSRNLGRRPCVRGIAMNPVDHPHGGRTNGGIPSVTPWGLPTKCNFSLKTREKMRRKKNKIIIK